MIADMQSNSTPETKKYPGEFAKAKSEAIKKKKVTMPPPVPPSKYKGSVQQADDNQIT
jgi:hypothetical protein